MGADLSPWKAFTVLTTLDRKPSCDFRQSVPISVICVLWLSQDCREKRPFLCSEQRKFNSTVNKTFTLIKPSGRDERLGPREAMTRLVEADRRHQVNGLGSNQPGETGPRRQRYARVPLYVSVNIACFSYWRSMQCRFMVRLSVDLLTLLRVEKSARALLRSLLSGPTSSLFVCTDVCPSLYDNTSWRRELISSSCNCSCACKQDRRWKCSISLFTLMEYDEEWFFHFTSTNDSRHFCWVTAQVQHRHASLPLNRQLWTSDWKTDATCSSTDDEMQITQTLTVRSMPTN